MAYDALEANLARLAAEQQAAGGTNKWQLAQLLGRKGAQDAGVVSEAPYISEAEEYLGLRPASKLQGSVGSQVSNILGNIPEADAAALQGIIQDQGGGGKGGTGISATGEFGPMSSGMKSSFGNISNALSALSTLGTMLGVAGLAQLGPLGVVAGMPATASTLAEAFGAKPGFDINFGVMSPTDIQSIRDYFGEDAAKRAAEDSKRQAEMNVRSVLGPLAAEDVGPPGLDLGDPTAAERAESMKSAAAGYEGGIMGGASPSDSSSSEGGNTGTSGGHAGGGDYAKGGVFRTTKPKTARIKFGEKGTGGETAVFVPENMKKPGLQGREREVLAALEALLTQLQSTKGEM